MHILIDQSRNVYYTDNESNSSDTSYSESDSSDDSSNMGYTALVHACISGRPLKIIKYLVENGADVNAMNN